MDREITILTSWTIALNFYIVSNFIHRITYCNYNFTSNLIFFNNTIVKMYKCEIVLIKTFNLKYSISWISNNNKFLIFKYIGLPFVRKIYFFVREEKNFKC